MGFKSGRYITNGKYENKGIKIDPGYLFTL